MKNAEVGTARKAPGAGDDSAQAPRLEMTVRRQLAARKQF